jgi:hypothetical protein
MAARIIRRRCVSRCRRAPIRAAKNAPRRSMSPMGRIGKPAASSSAIVPLRTFSAGAAKVVTTPSSSSATPYAMPARPSFRCVPVRRRKTSHACAISSTSQPVNTAACA